jgi:hypothetical protein
MVAKMLDFPHGLVKISDQSSGQLHMIGKASYVVTIPHGQHHNISSFLGSARKVVVLPALHLIIFFMMQYGQSFMCNIPYSSLKCSPRKGTIYHLTDMADMISHRLLVDDQPHVPEIIVPMKQPWDSDEKRGLAITQRQEECP